MNVLEKQKKKKKREKNTQIESASKIRIQNNDFLKFETQYIVYKN